MQSSARSKISLVVATGLLLGLNACGGFSDDTATVPVTPGSSGGKSGSTGGRGGSSASGSGGSTQSGGASGSSDSGGAVGSNGGSGPAAGGAAGAGSGGAPGGQGGAGPDDAGGGSPDTVVNPPATGDWMGYPGVPDLTQVVPTAGCGKPPADALGAWKAFDIANIPVPMGQRDNPGDGTRKYFVRLPPNYKPEMKYKVLIAASSCTGGNQSLAAMGDVGEVTDATGGAILISPVVEPGVWDRDQCYDDKDPNSIEHPFLERFLAQVGEKYCYDKNKVFVQGHSSGGWYSNMIGWTHTTGLLRGLSSNGGGLPDDSAERPKLNGKPMAGLWIHPQGDTEQPMAARRAVSRALVVNKCMGAGADDKDESVYMKAPSAAWAEGGGVGCKKYMCPAAFPVIFCQPGGNAPEPQLAHRRGLGDVQRPALVG